MSLAVLYGLFVERNNDVVIQNCIYREVIVN